MQQTELIQLTPEEVEEVDQMMNDHMHGHSISNSYAAFICNPRCRTEALGRSINKVLKEKQQKATEDAKT